MTGWGNSEARKLAMANFEILFIINSLDVGATSCRSGKYEGLDATPYLGQRSRKATKSINL